MMHSLLADALLVLHFAFIAFVVGGQGFIVIGWLRRWRGVRSIWFRAAHLLAIGVVAAQAWVGAWCPLTLWENQLRVAAGQSPYSGTFIQHWFGALVYCDAPPGPSPPPTPSSAPSSSPPGSSSPPAVPAHPARSGSNGCSCRRPR
jgi:hypothetical protein